MAKYLRAAAQRWSYSCLALALLIASCASNQEHITPAAKSEFGMKQLLRLPATKGRTGVDEVIHTLQKLYGVSLDTELAPDTNTKAPLTLTDGAILSMVFVETGPDGWVSVNMGVNLDIEARSCLTVEQAAALIGAKKMDEYLGDGVGYAGHTEYVFEDRDVNIRLVAQHPGPHCLGAVWIYKKRVPKVS